MKWAVVAVGVLAAPLLAVPQAEVKTPANCTIEGLVVKATTGEPLKKAVLSLWKPEGGRGPQKNATTDASGRFTIKEVEPGRYHLWAMRNGYVRQEYGARDPDSSGTILALAPGQQLRDVVFRLIPAAVISGRVFDEDGEPLARVEVQALRYRYEGGKRQLNPVESATTNDLGEYRIFGLAPGQYYVSANYSPQQFGEPAREEGYASVFYPSGTDPGRAVALDVHPGEEVPGIDLTFFPTKTFRIRGRVLNMVTGNPSRATYVSVVPREAGARNVFFETPTAPLDPQGNFEITGVAPGSYFVFANYREEMKIYRAREPIDVGNADVEGVTLVIAPGLDLKGRVRIEGRPAENLPEIRVGLDPRGEVYMWGGAAMVKSDGSFLVTNVYDDTYRLHVWGMPEDSYLKAAHLGSEDVLESGLTVTRKQAPEALEIVLSPNGARIEGVVLNQEQQPSSGASVVLVPEPSRRAQDALYKSTTTDQYGRFLLRGISPGEYKLFAWEHLEEGAYQDPEFIRRYEDRGQTVRLEEGGTATLQVLLIPSDKGGP